MKQRALLCALALCISFSAHTLELPTHKNPSLPDYDPSYVYGTPCTNGPTLLFEVGYVPPPFKENALLEAPLPGKWVTPLRVIGFAGTAGGLALAVKGMSGIVSGLSISMNIQGLHEELSSVFFGIVVAAIFSTLTSNLP